jgi:hypothetical protein
VIFRGFSLKSAQGSVFRIQVFRKKHWGRGDQGKLVCLDANSGAGLSFGSVKSDISGILAGFQRWVPAK